MKAVNVVHLNSWVAANKSNLSTSDRGTMVSVAARAAEDLGFKVPPSALSEIMRLQGIETRRQSKQKSKELMMLGEIERMTAENMELRRTLAKVAASDYVPEDFKEFVFAGLKEEIKTAIFSG